MFDLSCRFDLSDLDQDQEVIELDESDLEPCSVLEQIELGLLI